MICKQCKKEYNLSLIHEFCTKDCHNKFYANKQKQIDKIVKKSLGGLK